MRITEKEEVVQKNYKIHYAFTYSFGFTIKKKKVQSHAIQEASTK